VFDQIAIQFSHHYHIAHRVRLQSLFFQGSEDGIQLFAFDVGDGSGDDVAGNAAQNVGLVRRQTFQHIIEQGFDDGDEGVAVLIAKGSQPVTLKTDLKNFRQGQFAGTVPFP
jgi:hypothetical protein